MRTLGRRGGLLSLFLNSPCPLCQRSASNEFCRMCERQLQRCQFSHHDSCQAEPMRVFAWGSYSGVLKRAIGVLKYENNPQLARPLAEWLAQAWLTAMCDSNINSRQLTVVPIPMHDSKRQQRGFNQAELLAERFCDVTRLTLAARGLARSRETEAQFKLSAGDREQNLAGAFSLGTFSTKRPTGSVLLLDDIYTTGATVKSAAQSLRQHGISVYGVAVVARTVREKG